jgi:glycosyltransferase involved in cell wall biosynthesis
LLVLFYPMLNSRIASCQAGKRPKAPVMKIIQVPFCYAPDPIGGTEIYVSTLARQIRQRGVDVLIAAPSEQNREYIIDDIPVRRFAISPSLDLPQLYGIGDQSGAAEFIKIVDKEKPDIVHLHAFTAAVSIALIRMVKSRKIPIIFSYHTPTVSCQRGTLMLWGSKVCDGTIAISRCAACSLNGLGTPRFLARSIGAIPPELGARIAKLGLRGDVWTALQMSRLIELRLAAFRELAHQADHFVAVCEWVRDVLIVNGVPDAKITVSRHGIEWVPAEIPRAKTPDGKLKIAFVGRMDPTKGVHVLIKAVRSDPKAELALDIYGIVQNQRNFEYRREMLQLAHDDERISFKDTIPPGSVVSVMRRYDIIAVPSQWLETGPLVVLEAFAAGTPVIGWNVGGITELVRHGQNGLLIDSEEEWSTILTRLAANPSLRQQIRAGLTPPRTANDVANDMMALYTSFIGQMRQD